MRQLTWSLSTDLLEVSVEVMRPHGQIGNEGLALWLGTREQDCVTVTHVVSPTGPGFWTSPMQLRLSWNAMSSLTDLAEQLGCYLIGQVHSHPERFIDLSDVDQLYGVRCQDYLSVVCPYYAQHRLTGIQECGVHVFDAGAYWRLDPEEVAQRVAFSLHPVTKVELEVAA